MLMHFLLHLLSYLQQWLYYSYSTVMDIALRLFALANDEYDQLLRLEALK